MGFLVDSVSLSNGLAVINSYWTFRKKCTNDAHVVSNTPTQQQAGTAEVALIQRIPMCSADHFCAALETIYSFVVTEGDGTVTTVWFNPDAREVPAYTTDRVVAVEVKADFTASQVASAVVAAVGGGNVSVQSGSWVQWTNSVVGAVPMADVTNMPDYTRYILQGHWAVYASLASYKAGHKSLEESRFTTESPVAWTLPSYEALYGRFMLDARFVGALVTEL